MMPRFLLLTTKGACWTYEVAKNDIGSIREPAYPVCTIGMWCFRLFCQVNYLVQKSRHFFCFVTHFCQSSPEGKHLVNHWIQTVTSAVIFVTKPHSFFLSVT
jgi:hypothetical protein